MNLPAHRVPDEVLLYSIVNLQFSIISVTQGLQAQALPNYSNHVLNNAVDKHAKATYKTEKRRKNLFNICTRLKRKRKSLKFLSCLSIHYALQSSLAPGLASRLYVGIDQ